MGMAWADVIHGRADGPAGRIDYQHLTTRVPHARRYGHVKLARIRVKHRLLDPIGGCSTRSRGIDIELPSKLMKRRVFGPEGEERWGVGVVGDDHDAIPRIDGQFVGSFAAPGIQ